MVAAHLPPLQLFNANYLESKQSKNLFQPFPFSLAEKSWFSKTPYFWPFSQQITVVVHRNYVHCIFHWHPYFLLLPKYSLPLILVKTTSAPLHLHIHFHFSSLSTFLSWSFYFHFLHIHFHFLHIFYPSPYFHRDHSTSVAGLHLPTFNLESNFAGG